MPARFLVWEEPLEKEMATHSVFLPGSPMDSGIWRAPVQEDPRESDTEQLNKNSFSKA